MSRGHAQRHGDARGRRVIILRPQSLYYPYLIETRDSFFERSSKDNDLYYFISKPEEKYHQVVKQQL